MELTPDFRIRLVAWRDGTLERFELEGLTDRWTLHSAHEMEVEVAGATVRLKQQVGKALGLCPACWVGCMDGGLPHWDADASQASPPNTHTQQHRTAAHTAHTAHAAHTAQRHQ
jgi:hypothetical protein